MNLLEWILAGVLTWAASAVLVGLVAGGVIKRRDRQRPRPIRAACTSCPDWEAVSHDPDLVKLRLVEHVHTEHGDTT